MVKLVGALSPGWAGSRCKYDSCTYYVTYI